MTGVTGTTVARTVEVDAVVERAFAGVHPHDRVVATGASHRLRRAS